MRLNIAASMFIAAHGDTGKGSLLVSLLLSQRDRLYWQERNSSVNPEDVVELYSLLIEHGVHTWVDGGWGIDALLETQTRSHKDLDLMVRHDDLSTLTQILAPRGFTLKNIWDENRWTRFPVPALLIARGEAPLEIATAFVLKDGRGCEIDVHAFVFDERGYATPCWNTECSFSSDAFKGSGIIGGMAVRCMSAQWQMSTHSGYTLQNKDFHDIRLLHERFGIAYLPEHSEVFSNL